MNGNQIYDPRTDCQKLIDAAQHLDTLQTQLASLAETQAASEEPQRLEGETGNLPLSPGVRAATFRITEGFLQVMQTLLEVTRPEELND